ncbi:MAG TPA: hypothetical protein VKT28_05210 [Puia sp.]|nr:hypothetical protein [Puia sp.]
MNLTIKNTLTKKDYINASFAILISRPIFKIVIGFVILGISFPILTSLFNNKTFLLDELIPPVIFLILFFVFIYYQISKSFATNRRASEDIQYTFEEDVLIIKGETFSASFTLDKLVKVTKTNHWLLIWQTKQSANIIPLDKISNDQLNEIKKHLDWHKVKNNL